MRLEGIIVSDSKFWKNNELIYIKDEFNFEKIRKDIGSITIHDMGNF